MSEVGFSFFETLMMLVSTTALVWSMFSLVLFARKNQREKRHILLLECEINFLKEKLDSASEKDGFLKERLTYLEKSLSQLKKQSAQGFRMPEYRDKRKAKTSSIVKARDMLTQGASRDELMKLCGLSHSEANVLSYIKDSNNKPAASQPRHGLKASSEEGFDNDISHFDFSASSMMSDAHHFEKSLKGSVRSLN